MAPFYTANQTFAKTGLGQTWENLKKRSTFLQADEPGWYFPAESPEHYMNASLGVHAAALKQEWDAFLAKNKVTGLGGGGDMPLTNRW